MKWNVTDFPRKCQIPLLFASALLPVALLLGVRDMPETPFLGCAWFAFYVVWALLCLILPGKIRIPAGVLGCAAMIAAGVKWLPLSQSLFTIVIPLLTVVLTAITLPVGGWDREEEIHPLLGGIGLAVHVAAQLFLIVADRKGELTYKPIEPALTACFILFALLALLTLSRNSMRTAAAMGKSAPKSMKQRNTVLAVVLLIVTVVISVLPAVAEAIKRFASTVMIFVMRIVGWLMALLAPETTSTGGSPTGDSGFGGLPMDDTAPSLLSQIIEKVVMVISLIAVGVLLCIALYILGKKLWKLLKILWKRFSEYAATTSEDYEDEISDTRDDDDRKSTLRRIFERRVNPLKGIDERKLAPAARIRFYYLRTWLKHPDWDAGRTARENLPESAANLYERARYSRHEVSEADAEAFARHTDSL